MSGPNTNAQCFFPDSVAAMDDEAPVSAWRTYLMRSNTQHLIDMSPQHRINWAGTTDNDTAYVFSGNDDITYYYSHVFLHTWIDRRWPCGLDIHVCGKTDAGGDMAVKGRIVPHIKSAGLLHTVDDEYWSDSATISSATSVDIFNTIYYPGTTSPAQHGFRSFTIIDANGDAKEVKACLSRLDITWTVTNSSDSTSVSGLTRVSVREFC